MTKRPARPNPILFQQTDPAPAVRSRRRRALALRRARASLLCRPSPGDPRSAGHRRPSARASRAHAPAAGRRSSPDPAAPRPWPCPDDPGGARPVRRLGRCSCLAPAPQPRRPRRPTRPHLAGRPRRGRLPVVWPPGSSRRRPAVEEGRWKKGGGRKKKKKKGEEEEEKREGEEEEEEEREGGGEEGEGADPTAR
ncbi:uncharacterized protein [Miscanthus floridulus]|uniref:uncharacterized protein n=1 Tax=Miscanthus floridulus TaxID=154761 RepID=UPI00345AD4AC